MARIDEELTLYHPDGPWRFFEKRLRDIESSALESLVACPVEEVDATRAKLRLVRHLLSIPEQLRVERARLEEMLNDEPV